MLAGSGPLLWLLAWQYCCARASAIDALLDTTPRGRLAQRAARTRRRSCVAVFRARAASSCARCAGSVRVVEYVTSLGDRGRRARAPRSASAPAARAHTLPADHVLLHQGVVPDVNLADAAGCALAWNDLQACFAPVVDDWGGTTVPGALHRRRRRGHRRRAGRRSARPADGARASPTRSAASTAARATAPRSGIAATLATRIARPLVPRRAVPARGRVPGARRRDARVPLRGSAAAATIAQLARDGCAGPNQMKALHALRHGARARAGCCGLTVDRAHRARAAARSGGGRLLPAALSGQAGHARRPRADARHGGSRECRRAPPEPGSGSSSGNDVSIATRNPGNAERGS